MRAIHPDIAALMQGGDGPPLGSLPPEAMRRSYAESRRALAPPPYPVAAIRDATIDGPGGPLRLRIFHGPDPAAAEPAPCLLFLHGGGWVLGDLDTHTPICRHLAGAGRCCVVSVDYRLAPEHPFPAAVDDGAAALAWVAAQAATLGIDPARIAVGGDSAGGNVAAVLALMGRDGTLPRSVYQLLFYPVTDLVMAGDGYERPGGALPLTPEAMAYFIGHYAPDPATRMDWRASPLRAASLEGAPAALVMTCGHDPLGAEGRLYAERLERDGVAVTALHLGDQAHGILSLGTAIGAGPGLLDFAAACLREAWRTTVT